MRYGKLYNILESLLLNIHIVLLNLHVAPTYGINTGSHLSKRETFSNSVKIKTKNPEDINLSLLHYKSITLVALTLISRFFLPTSLLK